MLAQANALVKDRQSGQGQSGQTLWKRRVCRWQWRVQPRRRGSRKNCGGRSILTASFPEFIHELSFGSARGTGCCLR